MPRKLQPGEKLVECPICGWYHPQSFNGDCRDNENRFSFPDNPDDEAEFFDENDPRNPGSKPEAMTPQRHLPS
jgi:hypothetical protein